MTKSSDSQEVLRNHEETQSPKTLETNILDDMIDGNNQNEIKHLEAQLNEAKKRAKESIKQSMFKRSPEQIKKDRKTLIFILVWAILLTIFALMLPKDPQKPIERIMKNQKQRTPKEINNSGTTHQFDSFSGEHKKLRENTK